MIVSADDLLSDNNHTREWLLYRSNVTGDSAPWEPKLNLLVDMRVNSFTLDAAESFNEKLQEKNSIIGKAILLSTVTSPNGSFLGEARIFVNGALSERSDGGSSSPSPAYKKARYAVFEKDGRMRFVLTTEVGGSGSLCFAKLFEESENTVNAYDGVLDVTSAVARVCLRSRLPKRCNLCIMAGTVCECLAQMSSSAPVPGPAVDSTSCVAQESGMDLGLYLTRAMLEGSRTLIMNSLPRHTVDVVCSNSGPNFDRAALLVLHEEMKPADSESVSSHNSSSRHGSSSPSRTDRTSSCSSGVRDSGHASERPACHVCGVTFCGRYEMKRHVRTVHEKRKDFHCSPCNRSFSQKEHLNEHSRIVHALEDHLKCPTCGRPFGSFSKLSRHVLTVHQNVRMFSCDICQKRYKEGSYLRAHMAKVHNVKKTPKSPSSS
eukprot:Plantae.Rhodophyta-Purpureofilum_apyrenoidigerum.ctg25487.p1 GENE.Plantae.Rhodophyta-Purpureofilum_apyrenoidigerum.ctg25487~~Plantae.Rhodophyta-Purpureofilum_apyrenoidigerum.ctg25487.p1  ORF type:complete len:433 (-),score=58.84 Plantae.Rhodophyta-Purpureofilum_apyrenoidigerum.ctg25487:296-1594(-)